MVTNSTVMATPSLGAPTPIAPLLWRVGQVLGSPNEVPRARNEKGQRGDSNIQDLVGALNAYGVEINFEGSWALILALSILDVNMPKGSETLDYYCTQEVITGIFLRLWVVHGG